VKMLLLSLLFSINIHAKHDSNCYNKTKDLKKLLDFNKELNIQVEKAKQELKLELRLL
jgi:hypothetical protein